MNFLGFILQITGLAIGSLGALGLTLTEVSTKKEIAKLAGTYWNENPYLKEEFTRRSQYAIALAIVLIISFALQAFGLALSEAYA